MIIAGLLQRTTTERNQTITSIMLTKGNQYRPEISGRMNRDKATTDQTLLPLTKNLDIRMIGLEGMIGGRISRMLGPAIMIIELPVTSLNIMIGVLHPDLEVAVLVVKAGSRSSDKTMIAIAAIMVSSLTTDRGLIKKCLITGTRLCAIMTLANSMRKVNETKAQLIEDTKVKNHVSDLMATKIITIVIKSLNLILAVATTDSPIAGLTITIDTSNEDTKSQDEAMLPGTIRRLINRGKSRLLIVLSTGSRSGRVAGTEAPQAHLEKCTGLIIKGLKMTMKGSSLMIKNTAIMANAGKLLAQSLQTQTEQSE